MRPKKGNDGLPERCGESLVTVNSKRVFIIYNEHRVYYTFCWIKNKESVRNSRSWNYQKTCPDNIRELKMSSLDDIDLSNLKVRFKTVLWIYLSSLWYLSSIFHGYNQTVWTITTVLTTNANDENPLLKSFWHALTRSICHLGHNGQYNKVEHSDSSIFERCLNWERSGLFLFIL